MPHFAYQARTQRGRSEEGVVEAPTQDEAVTILQNRELLVVSVREKEAFGPTTLRAGARRLHKGVKPPDLVIFARSLAAMTEAGLPLLRALETVATQVRSQKLSNATLEITRDIRGGSTFRDAIARHPTIFSPFWISLVETGEASGQLTKALAQIGQHLEKMGAIQAKVISALIYPSMLLCVAIAAIFIFTLKIIPTFGGMFANFGAQLPLLTRMVIAFSNALKKYILFLLGGGFAAGFLLSNYVKTKPGRWQLDRFKLQMPIFGPIFQGASAEQFSSNLGTLLRAGVPILHALEITIVTCDNKVMASVIEQMRSGVREGRPLVEPLTQTDVFPPMVGQMLAVGEQTGKLPDMLDEVAKYYEEQVGTAITRMTALLEPVMLIGMGLVIGTLVISMYLPIFQMTQVIKG